MAKLQSDDLTLEIKFIDFKEEWVEYEIKFYWKDDIIEPEANSIKQLKILK